MRKRAGVKRAEKRQGGPAPVVADQGIDLPHEKDESSDPRPARPSEVIKQASRDLENGLVDTELRPAALENFKSAQVRPQRQKKSR